MIKEAGKEHLIHREFQFPEGYGLKSIVLRELTGKDEANAAKQLAALGTLDSEDIALLEANISQAIVAVDGELVKKPFFGISDWTMKVRRLVVIAFTELNSVTEEDADFFRNAKAEAPAKASDEQVLNEEDLA